MATMNFSIPDDVKEAFNEAFKDENKSAVVAKYLMLAVEDERRAVRESDFLQRMKARLAKQTRSFSAEEIRRMREDGRS
jgi:hypothetical protein